jgi:hypothetical protein
MTTDPTTAHDDAAFLAILHHVVFVMTPEQAAALMGDDEPITPPHHTHGPLCCLRGNERDAAFPFTPPAFHPRPSQGSRAGCRVTPVMAMELCPRSADTWRRSAPASSAWLAKQCLNQ